MSDAINRMMARFDAVYGPPLTHDVEQLVGEYRRALNGFSDAAIDKATDAIVRSHEQRWWPTPAVCRKACLAAAKPGIAQSRDAAGEWSKEAVSAAYALIVSDVGRAAAREGWVLSLWDFCRKQRRLPGGHEQQRLRDAAHTFDDAVASLQNPRTATDLALSALGEKMIERREKLAKIALGETHA